MQYRSKLLWWFLPPLILLLITLALYLLSPRIAQMALQHWLQAQNFSDITLNMQHPQWNNLRIEKLQLVKEENGKTLDLTAEKVVLRFNPVQLLLQRRLEHIQVSRAQLLVRYPHATTAKADNKPVNLSEILPSQWFSTVPVDLLTIGELGLSLDYPENIPDWQLTGALYFDRKKLTSRLQFQRESQELGWSDLEISATDQLHLRLLQQDQPFFELNGQLFYENTLKLQSQQQLELQGLMAWQQKLFNRSNIQLPLEGTLLSEGVTSFPLQTAFNPDELLLSVISDQTFQTQFSLSYPVPEIKQLNAELAGTLAFSKNLLTLKIAENSALQADGVVLEGINHPLKAIQVSLAQGLALQADLTHSMQDGFIYPEIEPVQLAIELPVIISDNLTLSPHRASLTLSQIDLPQQRLHGRLSVPSLPVTLPDQAVPELGLKADFSLQAQTLQGNFNLNTQDLPLQISGTFNSDLQQQSSQLNWQLKPVDLAKIDRKINHYIQLPAELSISQGTFFHKGTARISQGKFSASLNNSIRNGHLQWQEYRFNHIDWDSLGRLTAAGHFKDKGSIKLQQVKTGVDITNVLADYQFEHARGKQVLSLTALNAELLEGKVVLAPMSLDLTKPDFDTTVTVTQLDLGQVLSLEQQEGLTGEGKLSGSFPVSYQEGELTIEDGGLFSLKPGGIIMFAPDPTVMAYAATNVGLKMALEALENFHFDTLDIKLNYRKDGTAHLNTRLKGSNPDWNNGHPVDFTINIEENIPKLLQALQFTEKLTKSIEKRYR